MAELTTATTAAAAPPPVRPALATALVVSAVTLGVATFEMSMDDWPSGFVLLVLFPVMALTFIGCGLWSMTLLLRIRRHGVRSAAPFLVYVLTLLLLEYAPLQTIALQQNFTWHRANRERIVALVEAGNLKPNVDYSRNLIALGDSEANVSAGGNDIVVDDAGHGTYVLFLTSRGLKHHFSGFLHVPEGAKPEDFFEFDDKPPSRLVRYDKDWYFVAN